MTFVSSAIMLLTNHHGNEHWLWINWQQRGKTHKVDEHHTQRRWLMTLAASTTEASATLGNPWLYTGKYSARRTRFAIGTCGKEPTCKCRRHKRRGFSLRVEREAWCAAIHGVTRSRTWLSDWTELNLTSYELFYLFLVTNNSKNNAKNYSLR